MTARAGAAAMAAAAMPLLGDDVAARELANNVATALSIESTDPWSVAEQMLAHRARHFGLVCGDIQMCAAVMARAWNRTMAMASEVQP